MTELLTAAQMRAIEQAAIDSGEVTGLELMERAGTGVVEAILEEWPEMALTAQKAVVLCGPGNNGGDGFVVARLLKQRGWDVDVFLYGEVGKLPPDAKVNAEQWLELGEILGESISLDFDKNKNPNGAVVIDALFGTGLSRPILNAQLERIISWIMEAHAYSDRNCNIKIVSGDLPSGICSDSGRKLDVEKSPPPWAGPHSIAMGADLCVGFHSPKVANFLNAPQYSRARLVVVDIGLKSPQVHNSFPDKLFGVENRFRLSSPLEPVKRGQHKYQHGHALILSGPSARTGAARLAARGALRIGAGVVSLGAPQSAIAECAAQLTAIMLAPIEDGVALAATLQDKRINALCLGPALGLDERAEGLLEAAVGASTHPTVLDADALTILARRPDLFAKLHENCVLTPHAGEFKRLFPDIIAKLDAPATKGPAYSKVDATREAAARAGCVVLFKGADTVIAAPDGRAAINSAHYERAAPWLATAGAGDVLAGFITGLLARGFAPMQAAETAAWLHVECALKFGPGLIAEDLPEQLPAVFKTLSL